MTGWAHCLSNDRRQFVATREEPDGIRTVTLGWADPATDEQVRYAIEHLSDLRTVIEIGQRNTTWRRVTPFGRLYLTVLAGPPTWWLPRVDVRGHKVMVGWLRRAVVVAWRDGNAAG